MSRVKNFLFSLVAIGISLAVAIVVLEHAVRLVMPNLDPSGALEFRTDEVNHVYIGPPNSVQRQTKNTGEFDVTIRFNELGFRETTKISEIGPSDWFIIGDSVSFGWGITDGETVSDRLKAMTGQRFYNLSIPTSPPAWPAMVAYARKNGGDVRNLLVFFSTEVRLLNYDAPASAPSPAVAAPPMGITDIKNYLMRHSALYFLVTSYIHRVPALKAAAIRAGLINPVHEGFPPTTYDGAAIASTVAKLRELRAVCPNMAVVVLPNRGLWLGNSADVDRMYRDFVAAVRAAGLTVVDARPSFEAGGNPLQYFFKTDAHWNSAGHALVAGFVAGQLPLLGGK